jgi:hypothetical protein
MGFKDVINTVRTMLKTEELMFTNKDGTVTPRRFSPTELKKLEEGLKTLEHRYEAIARRASGPKDDGGLAKAVYNAADVSVTMMNNPHFIIAQNIEVLVGLGRRLGRVIFGDFGDKFWQGLLGSMSPIQRKNYLHGLGIQGQNVRGRVNKMMDVEYTGWDSISAQQLGRDQRGGLQAAYDWLKEFTLLGFPTYTLWAKASEVLPAQSRLVNSIEKLYKLRQLLIDNQGLEMTKAKWRQLVKQSGMGSRFDEADELQKLGILEDGVLEQIDTWVRDTQWQENVFDFDAMRDDLHLTKDRNAYNIKAKALRIMKSQSWNAATKTTFERRGQDIPTIATQGHLHAMTYKLTSFPQMFYRFNSRLLATRTLAQILPIWLMYIAGETMYARILDLARGRSPEEMMREWEEDPIGTSIVAASRLPFFGWSQMVVSSILELVRTWAGKEFNNEGWFGWKEGYNYPNLIGQFGGTNAINQVIRSVGALLSAIPTMVKGEEISTKQMLRMAKTVPAPFSPLIRASLGYALAEQRLKEADPSYVVPNDNSLMNGWLKGVGTDTGNRVRLEQIQKTEESRRQQKVQEAQERGHRKRIELHKEEHPLDLIPKHHEAPDALLEID